MPVHVDSEIGRLRRVLVHRPGREIDRMVPSMMETLLFDDILFGDEAREEHDGFRAVLASAEVAVLDPRDLLAEMLASEEPRAQLLLDLETEYGVSPRVVRELSALPAGALATALIEGLLSAAPDVGRRKIFDLAPLPNYFFQRDPLVILGNRAVVSSMATEAREREPLLSSLVVRHHPQLADLQTTFEIEVPPSGARHHDPSFPYPTLEGGDVLVMSPEIVCVGVSERTNRRGVEVLAEYLRL